MAVVVGYYSSEAGRVPEREGGRASKEIAVGVGGGVEDPEGRTQQVWKYYPGKRERDSKPKGLRKWTGME